MGFIYNQGMNDVTFAAPTPRGLSFLMSLHQRAQVAKLYTPGGTLNEGWNQLEQLLNLRRNVPVPRWAVYGPPTSRPLNPAGAQNMQNMTTLGLWQQLRQSGNQPYNLVAPQQRSGRGGGR